jgi:hypothetical protein
MTCVAHVTDMMITCLIIDNAKAKGSNIANVPNALTGDTILHVAVQRSLGIFNFQVDFSESTKLFDLFLELKPDLSIQNKEVIINIHFG